ncbi:MAG: putative TonB-dependent siderophore receptor, partial [Alphaproteobacteria bacterium]|nr:putative TonB-dependent siderophore receptor [Alphaproteobacteria bacterium]
MTDASRALACARTLFMAGTAAIAAPAFAFDHVSDAGGADAIVVTGTRGNAIEQPPATIESRDAARIARTTNVINSEDVLRYLPSLLVRKRHIGDTQAPLATRTSGVGASARSLIYVDDVLLSALIGNNNTSASPRWGMVSPDEIERVDVLYGPFSAAYPGNSIGAVVNFTTRLPDGPTGSLSAGASVQKFSQYATSGTYPATQLSATAGDRHGALAWFVSANHVTSQSQPLAYVTVAKPSATSAAGVPATGAVETLNRAGAPIFVIGAGAFEHQQQDNFKLKLGLDVAPGLRLTYRGGLFLNDTDAEARTYLGTAAGPAYAGALNLRGRAVNVPASAFSNNVYRQATRHWMHALTADGAAGALQWEAVASLYDFDKDVQRIPSAALPGALVGGGQGGGGQVSGGQGGGAGSITRLDGTGWRTLDLKARVGRGAAPRHDVSFGGHFDLFKLDSRRWTTDDWLSGSEGALVQAAQGRTRTIALWLQDRIEVGSAWQLTLGGRYEWWRAYDGFNFSLSPALSVEQRERRSRGLSPKASLRWAPSGHWSVTASACQAYRYPTVSDLYQAVSTGPSISVPDPTLRPERARSEELAIERIGEGGTIRLSLFNEAIREALIAQTAPLLPGSGSLFSYVQNIPRVRTRGAELAFDHHLFTPALTLSGSVTLAAPKVLEDPAFPAAEGKNLPQVPQRRATLLLTYQAPGGASLTAAARYSSRSFGTIDNSDRVTHTYQGFENYLVFDLRAQFRIGGHWE